MADITITAAAVLASSGAVIDRAHLFGATVTAGQAVYLDTAALTWKLIDSNAASIGNEAATIKGLALHGGATGQPAAVVLEDPDLTLGGATTNGSALYTSTTAGGVTHDVPTTGAYPTFLGLAKSTTKVAFRPLSTGVVI